MGFYLMDIALEPVFLNVEQAFAVCNGLIKLDLRHTGDSKSYLTGI
jgi:hypothetical protein